MFTTIVGNAILNAYLKGTVPEIPADWDISLHTGAPGQDGSNEVAAGGFSYERKEPTLGAVSSKSCTTTVALEWSNMPAETVTHIGLWGYIDSNWVFIWGSALDDSKAVPEGETFRLPIGEVDFDLDPA